MAAGSKPGPLQGFVSLSLLPYSVSLKAGGLFLKTRAGWICSMIVGVFALGGAAWGQAKKERVELIIAGGTVITMDAERRIVEDGAVAVTSDAIVAVATRPEILARYTAARQIGARGRLALPGFMKRHTHVPMKVLRRLKDGVTLDVCVENYIFPAVATNMAED